MNKYGLIFDNIEVVNNHIQIIKEKTHLKLILNKGLIDKQYKKVYELFDNNLVAIGLDNSREIINNKGEVKRVWKRAQQFGIYNDDEIHIGRFIDSLDTNYKIQKINNDNKLDISIGIESSDTDKIKLYINKGVARNATKLILYNTMTQIEIHSLIVNNITEIKFIEDNHTHTIRICDNDIRVLTYIQYIDK